MDALRFGGFQFHVYSCVIGSGLVSLMCTVFVFYRFCFNFRRWHRKECFFFCDLFGQIHWIWIIWIPMNLRDSLGYGRFLCEECLQTNDSKPNQEIPEKKSTGSVCREPTGFFPTCPNIFPEANPTLSAGIWSNASSRNKPTEAPSYLGIPKLGANNCEEIARLRAATSTYLGTVSVFFRFGKAP